MIPEVIDNYAEPETCSFSDLEVGDWFRSPRWGLMLKVSAKASYKPRLGCVEDATWNPSDLVRVEVRIEVLP